MDEHIKMQIRDSLTLKQSETKNFIVKTRSVYSHVYLVEGTTANEAIESVLSVIPMETQSLIRHDGESSVSVESVSDNFIFADLKNRFPEYREDV